MDIFIAVVISVVLSSLITAFVVTDKADKRKVNKEDGQLRLSIENIKMTLRQEGVLIDYKNSPMLLVKSGTREKVDMLYDYLGLREEHPARPEPILVKRKKK